ncbi:MAG: hypothetical protein JWM27_3243, partial [Gemmatimonadetes bacterium]|nr:hypothetical protein [Gemmatimonadota bacterium]
VQAARAAPGSLTPGQVLHLQRTVGNRAVAGLLRAGRAAPPAAVQRYHVLDPDQPGDEYQTQRFTGTNATFPRGQQADLTFANGVLEYSTRAPDKGYWGDLPRLRVSDGEQMAIEDDGGREQKVFFATEAVVAASRRRLADIGSRSTIAATDYKITVPTDDGTVTLDQVVPRIAEDADEAFANASSKCDLAASEVFNHESKAQTLLLGTGGGHALPNGTDAHMAIASGVTAHQQTAQALAQSIRQPPQPQRSQQAAQEVAQMFPSVDRIAPELLALYADTATPQAARDEMVIHVRAWAPGVEQGWYGAAELGEQAVQALALAWEENQPALDRVVERHRHLAGLAAYGARDPAADQGFGINAYAAPEVGEAFATFSVAPEGFHARRVDLPSQAQGYQALLTEIARGMQATVQSVDAAVRAMEDAAPSSWSWHYAAVVARDGADTVTLENYNREAEDRTVLERQAALLFAVHEQGAQIQQELQNWIQATHAAETVPDLAETYLGYADQARQALLGLGVTLRSDLQPEGERWFFQMYGPVKSQPGASDDQSFHHAWTSRAGEFSNALTVRVGAAADATFKQGVLAELDRRIDEGLGSWQVDERTGMKAAYRNRIAAAATRVEVARLLEDAAAEAREDGQSLVDRVLMGVLGYILPYPELED